MLKVPLRTFQETKNCEMWPNQVQISEIILSSQSTALQVAQSPVPQVNGPAPSPLKALLVLRKIFLFGVSPVHIDPGEE